MCEDVEKNDIVCTTLFFLICVLLEYVLTVTREYSSLQGHGESVISDRLWKMEQVSDFLVSKALELHYPTEHKPYGCGQNIHKIHWESHLLPEQSQRCAGAVVQIFKSFIWIHVRHECTA
jgi:hypothetical protein